MFTGDTLLDYMHHYWAHSTDNTLQKDTLQTKEKTHIGYSAGTMPDYMKTFYMKDAQLLGYSAEQCTQLLEAIYR